MAVRCIHLLLINIYSYLVKNIIVILKQIYYVGKSEEKGEENSIFT